MVYAVIAVVLLLWGALVGRAGQKTGTVLAMVPVVVWFGLLAWSANAPSRFEGNDLVVYLLIGLLAFTAGLSLVNHFWPARKRAKNPD